MLFFFPIFARNATHNDTLDTRMNAPKKLEYSSPQTEELVLWTNSFLCGSSEMSTGMETLLEDATYEWII